MKDPDIYCMNLHKIASLWKLYIVINSYFIDMANNHDWTACISPRSLVSVSWPPSRSWGPASRLLSAYPPESNRNRLTALHGLQEATVTRIYWQTPLSLYVCVCYANVKRVLCSSYKAAHAQRLLVRSRSRALRLLFLALSLPPLLVLHLLLEQLHEAAVVGEGVGRFGRPVRRAAAAGLPAAAAAAGGLLRMRMVMAVMFVWFMLLFLHRFTVRRNNK